MRMFNFVASRARRAQRKSEPYNLILSGAAPGPRSSRRHSAPLLLLLALTGCGADGPDVYNEGPSGDDAELRSVPACRSDGRGKVATYCAEIRRTSFGIPHVRANNEKGLGFGAGYAYAQDNFCLLAEAIVTVNGERSKYFGPTESYDPNGSGEPQNNLSSDFYYKYLNATNVVRAAFQQQPGEVKDLARGYAAGVNRYLQEVTRDELPAACRSQAWVRAIDELDLMRLMRRVAVEEGGANFIDAFYLAEPPGVTSPLVIQPNASDAGPPPKDMSALPSARKRGDAGLGSNGIALGRRATESGGGLLLANPHFPWKSALRFYEMHLTIPGKVNVMGAALPGFPVVNIGFNDNVAWTHTVDASMHFTLFELQLHPDNPTRYIVDGRSKTMAKKELSVEIVGTDGEPATIKHTYYSTEYGPVVNWAGPSAFALADANLHNNRLFQQWWEFNKATSVAAVKRSVETTMGVPWVNSIAADRAGNVFYGNVSPVPNLSDAMVEACVSPEYLPLLAEGLFILAGNTGACQWQSDMAAPEPGLVAGRKMPSLLRNDFVQNSNDSAWLSNPSQRLTGFPAIVSRDSYEQNGRTRIGLAQIAARLSGADGEPGDKFNLDSLQNMVLSNRSMSAAVLLDDLRAACADAGSVELEPGLEVDLTEGCAVLSSWDGKTNLDSIGWPLFATWRQLMNESGVDYWAVPFDTVAPIMTPLGLKLDDESVYATSLGALGYAMITLEEAGIDYTKPWGELQVAVLGEERVPIHGGGDDDIYNAMYSAPLGDGQLDVTFGSSALFVVSFEAGAPKARGFLAYSQSSEPDSAFFADQTRRFSEKKWIDLPFTNVAITSDPNYSSAVVVGN